MRSKSDVNLIQGVPKIYKVDLPYPEIDVEGTNKIYAQYMLEDMAGMISEMSAVSAYLYQELMINPEYRDVVDALRGIGAVEMQHLHIFGELARQLGAEPRLWEQKRNTMRYWSPSYIQYPIKLEDMLRYDIRSEKEAINQYSKQARVILDRNVVNILQRIILDEELHVEILTDLYNKYFKPIPR